MGYSMRTNRYRYTRWQNTSGVTVAQELYDHQDDPIAYQNLAAWVEYADTVQQLDAVLTKEWATSLAAYPN